MGAFFDLYSMTSGVLDSIDGATDGIVDVDNLTASGRGNVNQFISSSGQNFTVSTVNGFGGPHYLITLENGDVIAANGKWARGPNLDTESGQANDGLIDIDNLIDGTSNDYISLFYSESGASFTVKSGADNATGGSGTDYIIEFADGRVIVARSTLLSKLDSEDGTSNGTINVDALFDDASNNQIAEFFSTSGQKFEITQGPNGDGNFFIHLENGNVIVTQGGYVRSHGHRRWHARWAR